MQCSVKSELNQGNTFLTMEEQQWWLNDYRGELSNEMPHEALARCGNPRAGSGLVEFLDMFIRQIAWSTWVKSRGTFHMGKKGTVFLREALTGENNMLKEQDDGLEAIIFNG